MFRSRNIPLECPKFPFCYRTRSRASELRTYSLHQESKAHVSWRSTSVLPLDLNQAKNKQRPPQQKNGPTVASNASGAVMAAETLGLAAIQTGTARQTASFTVLISARPNSRTRVRSQGQRSGLRLNSNISLGAHCTHSASPLHTPPGRVIHVLWLWLLFAALGIILVFSCFRAICWRLARGHWNRD